jgi:hypothetical protein
MVSFPQKAAFYAQADSPNGINQGLDEAIPLGSILPEVLRRYGLEAAPTVDRAVSLAPADDRRRRLAATRYDG